MRLAHIVAQFVNSFYSLNNIFWKTEALVLLCHIHISHKTFFYEFPFRSHKDFLMCFFLEVVYFIKL